MSIRDLRTRALRYRAQAEAERTRLAGRVHDELTQPVMALKIGLAELDRAVRASPRELLPARIAELQAMAGELAHQLRTIAEDLAPLHDASGTALPEAIRILASQSQQAIGIPIRCELSDVDKGAGIRDIALCVLVEALDNIRAHAQASEVVIRLRDRGRAMALEIQDDGLGFHPGRLEPQQLGIFGARQCVARAGGKLRIESARGRGTRLLATIPYQLEGRA